MIGWEGKSEASDLHSLLNGGMIDFIDFGCSEGGSYEFAIRRLRGTRGIGLDIDPKKVDKARARGVDAFVADATKAVLPPKCVKFVVMSHFLEHLDSGRLASKCMSTALNAASEFVLIRVPYFDANAHLLQLGLKLYSADWKGHPNLMTSYDIWRGMRPFLDADTVSLTLHGRFKIENSADISIVPLAAPVDIRKRDLENFQHGKKAVTFSFAMYKELVAIAIRRENGVPVKRMTDIISNLGDTELLCSFGS